MAKLEAYDLSRSAWERLIDGIFCERDRAILKRRLLDGITFEKLAEEFDLSTQRICAIVYQAQDRLFRQVEKNK